MSEKQREEIAKFAVLYLKKRMMINQRLISISENKIDFDSFMNTYNGYLNKIKYADEHPNEIMNINGESISFVERVNQLKMDFVRINADFIVMTEAQIDELMGYIKTSIENYGFTSKDFYNENFFVREVLEQLIFKMGEMDDKVTKEKRNRVETYLKFIQAAENIGFCDAIGGKIFYSNDKFFIINHNFKKVCEINNKGINEISDNELAQEDILIADKMYIGVLSSDENKLCVFLEKMVNGQRKMKVISHNQKIYDITEERHEIDKIITFEQAILYDNIKDFFNETGFSFLSFDIYTKESFKETIEAFNKLNNMSFNERDEIENIVKIAISWWLDNVSYSKNEGIRIQKFKETLGNRLRILLLSRATLSLMVDYRPEGELAFAIEESKLEASFPMKTYMSISKDKIEVQKGYGAPFEVIYSKDMTTDLKK